VGDVLGKKPERRSTEESARVVHAVRMARRVVRDRHAVVKLFDEIAPRFAGRHGGYTRIVKLDQRPGDAAPMSLLELIPDEGAPVAKETAPAKGKGGAKTGVEVVIALEVDLHLQVETLRGPYMLLLVRRRFGPRAGVHKGDSFVSLERLNALLAPTTVDRR
jgi:large subunit ribosomal protein L17